MNVLLAVYQFFQPKASVAIVSSLNFRIIRQMSAYDQ